MLVSSLSQPPLRHDVQGNGAFLASRGNRPHYGTDFYAYPGAPIHVKYDCELVRVGQAYSSTKRYNLIELIDGPLFLHYFYVQKATSLINGQVIRAGGIIGAAQDIADHYRNGMQNHVHFACFIKGKPSLPDGVNSIYHSGKGRTYIDPLAYLDGRLGELI